jgi:hypothetical protein
MRCEVSTKIIFSDGKILCLKATDAALCEQLKEVRTDKALNDLLLKLEGRFVQSSEAELGDVNCTIDLRKKKLSSVKKMKQAFGVKR